MFFFHLGAISPVFQPPYQIHRLVCLGPKASQKEHLIAHRYTQRMSVQAAWRHDTPPALHHE